MLTRTTSGWFAKGLPGRIFPTKKAVLLALAYAPGVQDLLSDAAKAALSAEGYAGERPLIQALVDSAKHWESTGDAEKAARTRVMIDEMLGKTEKEAPKGGMATRPSKTISGWVNVMDQGMPLIDLPEALVGEFMNQYQQAKGDEELEMMVYNEFKSKADAARPAEPVSEPKRFKPESARQSEDEIEDFGLGKYTAKAQKIIRWFPTKRRDKGGKVVYDAEGKPKKGWGQFIEHVLEIYMPDKELPIYKFRYSPRDNDFSYKENVFQKTKLDKEGEEVPDWTAGESQSPTQLLKTLSRFGDESEARAILDFLGFAKALASKSNVIVRVAM